MWGGYNTQSYIEKCKQTGIFDCVNFPGWISGIQKENMLRKASVCLLPSYYEGMPISLLEAMSYGLAVVASNVGGIPSVIEDGVNGLLINPGDIEAIAGCVNMLLDNHELKKQLGEQARITIKNDYNLEHNKALLCKIFSSIIG